ncbi:MAG: MFS transporter [Planctomycetota bacterium]
MSEPIMPQRPPRESLAGWLGLNRTTVAVLVAIAGLGLSEEIWKNFFGIHLLELISGGALKDLQAIKPEQVTNAIFYLAVYAFFVNLAEGFGYIIGGTVAHRMGVRIALVVSAIPMLTGFSILFIAENPWLKIVGALLLTNWEPLSVPATFEVVGSELPKNRRTIAFAMQSIQKRLPKVIGPLLGVAVFVTQGYWLNLTMALAVLIISIVVQMSLLRKMKPKDEPSATPIRQVLRDMPTDLRMLLSAEIILRWGDWFVRDFAAVYVVGVLLQSPRDYGFLAALTAFIALITYIPIAKLVDRAPSPKPYIGLTFFLFAAFPFCLVLLPKIMPVMLALVIAFVVNGLRELGEPARKAMIASGFPKEVRARAVGLYWGLRSFAFFPAPIVAYVFWKHFGPDWTFLAGGALGMLGVAWFWISVRCAPTAGTSSQNERMNTVHGIDF